MASKNHIALLMLQKKIVVPFFSIAAQFIRLGVEKNEYN